MIIRILSIVLGIVLLAWLVLLFSSRAVLVGEEIEPTVFRDRLVCTYFTGSRTMQREYAYSKSDTMGRAACPRWERVRAPEE